MGTTCIGWWYLSVNWDAVSAIATFIATCVALGLPLYMARREWSRQDRIRQEEAERDQQKLIDVRHEVCSAVDRILAYRDAAIALFDSEPPYWVGYEAIYRIQLNTGILFDVLDLLRERPELSDGAIFSAVAGRKIAKEVLAETGSVTANWATGVAWAERKAALASFDLLATVVQQRADGVREYHNLSASESAANIRAKYIPLANAIANAKAQADGQAPDNTLAETYY